MRTNRRTACVAAWAIAAAGLLAAGTARAAQRPPDQRQALRALLNQAAEACDRGEAAAARAALRKALNALTDDRVERLVHDAAQARDEGRIADFRRKLKSALGASDPAFWLVLGFAAQLLFTSRFLVQWIVSERKGRSVIPMAFWYFSLSGSALLLTYAIWRRDPVFILGQAFGCIVYVRNLMLIFRRRGQDGGGAAAAPAR